MLNEQLAHEHFPSSQQPHQAGTPGWKESNAPAVTAQLHIHPDEEISEMESVVSSCTNCQNAHKVKKKKKSLGLLSFI